MEIPRLNLPPAPGSPGSDDLNFDQYYLPLGSGRDPRAEDDEGQQQQQQQQRAVYEYATEKNGLASVAGAPSSAATPTPNATAAVVSSSSSSKAPHARAVVLLRSEPGQDDGRAPQGLAPPSSWSPSPSQQAGPESSAAFDTAVVAAYDALSASSSWRGPSTSGSGSGMGRGVAAGAAYNYIGLGRRRPRTADAPHGSGADASRGGPALHAQTMGARVGGHGGHGGDGSGGSGGNGGGGGRDDETHAGEYDAKYDDRGYDDDRGSGVDYGDDYGDGAWSRLESAGWRGGVGGDGGGDGDGGANGDWGSRGESGTGEQQQQSFGDTTTYGRRMMNEAELHEGLQQLVRSGALPRPPPSASSPSPSSPGGGMFGATGWQRQRRSGSQGGWGGKGGGGSSLPPLDVTVVKKKRVELTTDGQLKIRHDNWVSMSELASPGGGGGSPGMTSGGGWGSGTGMGGGEGGHESGMPLSPLLLPYKIRRLDDSTQIMPSLRGQYDEIHGVRNMTLGAGGEIVRDRDKEWRQDSFRSAIANLNRWGMRPPPVGGTLEGAAAVEEKTTRGGPAADSHIYAEGRLLTKKLLHMEGKQIGKHYVVAMVYGIGIQGRVYGEGLVRHPRFLEITAHEPGTCGKFSLKVTLEELKTLFVEEPHLLGAGRKPQMCSRLLSMLSFDYGDRGDELALEKFEVRFY